jgi:ubiquinone/menaquinone biosynthesis C-methylase UbiE
MTKTSRLNRVGFRLMSLIHDDLYRLIRNPDKTLMSAGLGEGQTVLEIGCGPGFFTAPAAKAVGPGGRLVSVDINPLAIEKAGAKIRRSGVENATTLLADAAQLNLPDEEFDLVFVFGVSWRGSRESEVMKELQRVMKSGGILAIEGRSKPPPDVFDFEAREGMIRRYRKSQAAE